MELFLKSLIIIPIVLFIVTACLITSCSRKLKTFRECTGTIVRFDHQKYRPGFHSESRINKIPVVAYTVNGRTYEFYSDYVSSSMKAGRQLRLLYREEDPAKATVRSRLFVGPIVAGSLALSFSIAYVVCMVLLHTTLP